MEKIKKLVNEINSKYKLLNIVICFISILLFIIGRSKIANHVFGGYKQLGNFFIIITFVLSLLLTVFSFTIKNKKTLYLVNSILSLVYIINIFLATNFRIIGANECYKLPEEIICEKGTVTFGEVLFIIIFVLSTIYLVAYLALNIFNYYMILKNGDSTNENDELEITEITQENLEKANIFNSNNALRKNNIEERKNKYMEYRLIKIGNIQGSNMDKAITNLESLLNDLGKEGWQFVAIEEIRTVKGCIKPTEEITKVLIVGR